MKMDDKLFIYKLYQCLISEFDNGNIYEYDELEDLMNIALIMGDYGTAKEIRDAMIIATID